ncbi:MAG TPA: biotin/lipoyl-binding protein, partial [Thermoanaerobaculia bacterium]
MNRLLPAMIATLLLACSGDSSDERKDAIVPAVEAVQARSGALPLRERFSGMVRAENQVAIRAEIDAPIMEVFVRSGEAVRRGQPLVRLDDRRPREQLRQAEANVRLTEGAAAESAARVRELEVQLVRTRQLAEQQLVSSVELETLQAQMAAARASAEQAAARIEQARAAVREQQSELG